MNNLKNVLFFYGTYSKKVERFVCKLLKGIYRLSYDYLKKGGLAFD